MALHLQAANPAAPAPLQACRDEGCAMCRIHARRLEALERANATLRRDAERVAARLQAAMDQLAAAALGVNAEACGGACTAAGMPHLATRERQVLRLIAEGQRTPSIAGRLGIAGATVEVHRRNIMRKLGLHSVAQLTRYAVREGITAL